MNIVPQTQSVHLPDKFWIRGQARGWMDGGMEGCAKRVWANTVVDTATAALRRRGRARARAASCVSFRVQRAWRSRVRSGGGIISFSPKCWTDGRTDGRTDADERERVRRGASAVRPSVRLSFHRRPRRPRFQGMRKEGVNECESRARGASGQVRQTYL